MNDVDFNCLQVSSSTLEVDKSYIVVGYQIQQLNGNAYQSLLGKMKSNGGLAVNEITVSSISSVDSLTSPSNLLHFSL